MGRSRWTVVYFLLSGIEAYSLQGNQRTDVAPAISTSKRRRSSTSLFAVVDGDCLDAQSIARRHLLLTAAGAPMSLALCNSAMAAEETGFEVIKTPSGLKYLDLVPGTGRTPAYGEFVSIAYTSYIKLPNNNAKRYSSEPQKFDHVDAYLFKHGNGRTIAGLDEGLHTMKEGGTRRILIPPKLGYVDIGLGPLPESPWNRDKLNRLLDQMIELSGGTLIYEVTLKSIVIDEADQGYYQDESLSPEDYDKFRNNMQQQATEERLAKEAREQLPKNSDKVM